MGNTGVPYATKSWNTIIGCEHVSPGCEHCYACRLAATRLRHNKRYRGLTYCNRGLSRRSSSSCLWAWTGEVRVQADRLLEPTTWRDPQNVFVCDMADLFHRDVTDELRDQMIAVMAETPQHQYLLLTKRPEEMRRYSQTFGKLIEVTLNPEATGRHIRADFMKDWFLKQDDGWLSYSLWPLPNVGWGVTAENQYWLEQRIQYLRETRAAWRFLSLEPLLGPIDLNSLWPGGLPCPGPGPYCTGIDWVVVGGESGPGARPMHPAWVRDIRNQCKEAGVPFYFKGWGAWRPLTVDEIPATGGSYELVSIDPERKPADSGCFQLAHQLEGMITDPVFSWRCPVVRTNKATEHRLDGIEYRELPAALLREQK